MSKRTWAWCRSQGEDLGGTASSADLVVVAIIQMGILKAEVGKGSMRTEIGHGLLDPKIKRNCFVR